MSAGHETRGTALRTPKGLAIVHFDGSCQSTRRGTIAGFGFTVDLAGDHHEGWGLAVPPGDPRATNNVAEYTGAIEGLDWLARRGFEGDVRLVGDSQLVVRQMRGEYRVRAEHLRPFHERLARSAGRFRRVRFEWVPREANERADALSKQALRSMAGSP